MVSSWGGGVTTYPETLLNEIRSLVDECNMFVDLRWVKYNDVEPFLEDLNKAVGKKLGVSRNYVSKGWDLFIDVVSFTDWLQHRMWRYIDPKHPMYLGDKEASRYRKRFTEFWQLLDE